MAVETLYSAAADRRIEKGDAVWATARAATSGTLGAANQNPVGIGDDLDTGVYYIRRFFMEFTSTVKNSSATAVAFKFTVDVAGGATVNLHLVASSQANPVVADDYNNVTLTSFGSVSIGVGSTGLKTITLNSTGITYINANLGGTIKLALVGDSDVLDSAPAPGSYVSVATGDDATEDDKPRLEITYVPCGGAFLLNMI